MDGNGLDRCALHIDVPYLDCEVIAGKYVSAIVGKPDIRYGRYDFREEGSRGWVFLLFEFCTGNQLNHYSPSI